MKAWSIKEEWATDREKWKCLCKTRYGAQGDGGERRENIINNINKMQRPGDFYEDGNAVARIRSH